MTQLSIIIPTIRAYNWQPLLESIEAACTRYRYEVIFVGPVPDPTEYLDCAHYGAGKVRFISDYGHPNRCQHIGAMVAAGDILHFGSDDCMYQPGSIDVAMAAMGNSRALTANYAEGGNSQPNMTITKCYGNNFTNQIEDDWLIFNVLFIRQYAWDYLGGFDCRYQTTCWGHTDLAARYYKFGQAEYDVKLFNDPVLSCSHMPGTTGDHAPIHYSFYEDQQRFQGYKLSWPSMRDVYRHSDPVWRKRCG